MGYQSVIDYGMTMRFAIMRTLSIPHNAGIFLTPILSHTQLS